MVNVEPTPHGLLTNALDYPLPQSLIATRPARPRDTAKMMVVSRSDPDLLEHRHVRDLPEYLHSGDALVFNNTAVLPARLIGKRTDTSGAVEGLFLNELPHGCWLVMLKCNGKLRPEQHIELQYNDQSSLPVILELVERDDSRWIARPIDDDRSTSELLNLVGRTPLPPYILRARGDEQITDEQDRHWYETVFADPSNRHSVAAPTAGLHFTQDLFDRIDARDVRRIQITLHVGPGTFKPIDTLTVETHQMHRESYEVSAVALEELHATRNQAGRIFAVGTTSVRTLESLPPPPMPPKPSDTNSQSSDPIHGQTELLICPPYRFQFVDGLLTNFHLPRSTLLALVAALISLERLLALYQEAIDRRYRFYSYGDAMLILP